MFEARFSAPGRRTVVALPFPLDAVLADWERLRSPMAREKPEAFTRDEWAYLIRFLDGENLGGAFCQAFGSRDSDDGREEGAYALARPGGAIAVWLPNNVSLLGALALVLLSLTGNPLRIKAGSRGGDLTGDFLDYVLHRLPPGALRDHLGFSVQLEAFSRADPRNAAWAGSARTRIVFGSDAAAEAIDALPHPRESVGFSFGHRESEAWIETAASDETLLATLLAVFNVYGQAACTSPARVVLLDGTATEALALRDRLLEMWPRRFPRSPEMAVASAAVLDHQWALSLGWDSRLARGHGAAFAAGSDGLARPGGLRLLPIVALPEQRAFETLPDRIQTLGYGLTPARARSLLGNVARSAVKRFVPLSDMHRFGPVWDGRAFWRETFHLAEAQA